MIFFDSACQIRACPVMTGLPAGPLTDAAGPDAVRADLASIVQQVPEPARVSLRISHCDRDLLNPAGPRDSRSPDARVWRPSAIAARSRARRWSAHLHRDRCADAKDRADPPARPQRLGAGQAAGDDQVAWLEREAAGGHPAVGLAWLAGQLAAHGRALEPGDLVITGGLTSAQPLRAGSRISAAFGAGGSVTVEVGRPPASS